MQANPVSNVSIRSAAFVSGPAEGSDRVAGIGSGRPVTVGGGPLVDDFVQSAIAHHETGRGGFAGASTIGQVGKPLAQVLDKRRHPGVIETGDEREQLGVACLQELDSLPGEVVIVELTRMNLNHALAHRPMLRMCHDVMHLYLL